MINKFYGPSYAKAGSLCALERHVGQMTHISGLLFSCTQGFLGKMYLSKWKWFVVWQIQQIAWMEHNTLPKKGQLPARRDDFEQNSLAAGQCSSTKGFGRFPKHLWRKTHCENRKKADSKSTCQSPSAKMWEVQRRTLGTTKVKRKIG